METLKKMAMDVIIAHQIPYNPEILTLDCMDDLVDYRYEKLIKTIQRLGEAKIKEFTELQPYYKKKYNAYLRTIVLEEITNSVRIQCDNHERIGYIAIDTLENIESIELRIGGNRIDTIYPELIPLLQKLYDMDGLPFHILKCGIPYLAWWDKRIQIQRKDITKNIIYTFTIKMYANTEAGTAEQIFIFNTVKTTERSIPFAGTCAFITPKKYKINSINIDNEILESPFNIEMEGFNIYSFIKSFDDPLLINERIPFIYKDTQIGSPIVYKIAGNLFRRAGGMGGTAINYY
jgi:hypothetical protein